MKTAEEYLEIADHFLRMAIQATEMEHNSHEGRNLAAVSATALGMAAHMNTLELRQHMLAAMTSGGDK